MAEQKYNQDSESIMISRSNISSSLFNNFFIDISSISKNIRKISDIGINFSNIGSNRMLSVPRNEDSSIWSGNDTRIADVTVPYFKQNYQQRIEFLRGFCSNPEIEDILEKISDEAIIYNSKRFFCDVNTDGYADKEVANLVKESFNRLYSLFGFQDGTKVWCYYYQWLIEGTLVFEKIFDDVENPTKLIGIVEIDPVTVVPYEILEEIRDEDGNVSKKTRIFWKQITTDGNGIEVERIIPDTSIIYISWDKIPGGKGKLSYSERLIRNFNLMRTMENTSIAYHVMNSQFRMKMLIPVGDQTVAMAKQAISEIKSSYKEDIYVDYQSGEVSVNGQSNINWGRSIILPKGSEGESPEIESFAYDGPDLTKMDAVDKFTEKYQQISKLPRSRFDFGDGTGTMIALFGTEGIPYDEDAFYKFIDRTRQEFKKILVSAIHTDCILRDSKLKFDSNFESKINLEFESNSMYQLAKEYEIQSVLLENLQKMEQLEGPNGRPLYSKEYLYVTKFKIMTKEEWDEMKKLVEDENKINNNDPNNMDLENDMMESLFEVYKNRRNKNKKYVSMEHPKGRRTSKKI